MVNKLLGVSLPFLGEVHIYTLSIKPLDYINRCLLGTCDVKLLAFANISEWMCSNKLSLNASKSEFLIVGHKGQLNGIQQPVQLKIDEDLIKKGPESKISWARG